MGTTNARSTRTAKSVSATSMANSALVSLFATHGDTQQNAINSSQRTQPEPVSVSCLSVTCNLSRTLLPPRTHTTRTTTCSGPRMAGTTMMPTTVQSMVVIQSNMNAVVVKPSHTSGSTSTSNNVVTDHPSELTTSAKHLSTL